MCAFMNVIYTIYIYSTRPRKGVMFVVSYWLLYTIMYVCYIEGFVHRPVPLVTTHPGPTRPGPSLYLIYFLEVLFNGPER